MEHLYGRALGSGNVRASETKFVLWWTSNLEGEGVRVCEEVVGIGKKNETQRGLSGGRGLETRMKLRKEPGSG